MYRLFIVLSFIFLEGNVSGQICFERLSDLSGVDLSGSDNEVESAACDLRDSLPANFRSDFKVYDAGFYIFMDKFNGFTYPEGFEVLRGSVSSTYYVLVGKQNDPNGLFTKFWVDVNLPDITGDGCIPNRNLEASKLVEFVISREYEKSGRSPSSYPGALIQALEALNRFVKTAEQCCDIGGEVGQCMDCNNPDNIGAKLLSLGFIQESIENIGDYSASRILPAEVVDHANLLFTVNGLVTVDVPSSYIGQIPMYHSKGLSVKIYITEDENVCTNIWQDVQNEIEQETNDVVFWHHIHRGDPNELGGQKLFTRVFIKGGANFNKEGPTSQSRALGPDPVTAIIGALGAALSDVMMQTVSIYYLSDDIEEGDWGEAFDRVNYGSVAWSGFTGLFVVNSKMITVAVAVGAATVEVTYNAYNNPDYTIEQAALDFGRVFVADLIGSAVGGAVGKKLKDVNLSWFSGAALNKLRFSFGNSNTAKSAIIKLCWKLQAENITTHTARGSQFEDWLFEWLLSSRGFVQTDHWFKGIDYHKAVGNIGTSLKTTIQTSKNGLRNLIKKNIVDLRDAKISGEISFQGVSYDIDEARLLILVPEANVSGVTQKINELISELDPGGVIDAIDVKSFENMLGL